MYTAFEKQPEEKKSRILSVCTEEFAVNGYEQASTDTITIKAGISKGILFHYFKNKKNCFLYTTKIALTKLTGYTLEVLDQITAEEFFTYITEMLKARIDVLVRYPYESKLIMRVFMNPPSSSQHEVQQLIADQWEFYEQHNLAQKMFRFDLIHADRLREGITQEKVVKMTQLLVESYANSLLSNPTVGALSNEQIHAMIAELEDYLEIVKRGIYID